jgi:SAM-dependent methyltransferase
MPDLFTCPSCRGSYERTPDSLRCACGTWPVVEGIPILTPWARGRTFTLGEILARHRPAAQGFADKILRRLFPGTGRMADAAMNREASFLELAEALGRTADLDYFRYRFSDLSYLAAAALLTPLDRGPVLDLGCGAGHLTYALSRRIPRGIFVGLDLNFTLLYLARRFLAPAALFVCSDASAPLPFRDGAFEAAVCSNTYNYLPDRAATARELLRVTRGPLLLAHLDDPSFHGPGSLPPLKPEDYVAMFAARGVRLYRERELLESFLRTRTLDLTRTSDSASDILSLAAGVEAKVWPGADYFVTGTQINPIYETHEEGGSIRLKRRFISDRHSEAYRAYEEFLPESLTVTREQIAAADPELVRKFVLLDLPPLYC